MSRLPAGCVTYCKHVGGGEFFEKRDVGKWIVENIIEFNSALDFWMKYKKHGAPWVHWGEAPAHLFDLVDALDVVFDGIQADKVGRHGH